MILSSPDIHLKPNKLQKFMSLTEAAGVWDFATDAVTQTFKTFNFILSSSSDDNFFASLTNVEPQKCLLYGKCAINSLQIF